MAEIKAGDEITADWWPPSVKAESSTDIDNITNTTFAAGSPVVAAKITAPPSRRGGGWKRKPPNPHSTPFSSIASFSLKKKNNTSTPPLD